MTLRSVDKVVKSAQLPQRPGNAGRQKGAADNPGSGYLIALLAVAALGLATIAFAYWPGVMIDDARWQYQQSVDNAYEDWHPPLMAWIWRQFMLLEPGPGPMLLLQLSLYWAGIALVAAWLYRRNSPKLAIAAACAGWLPAPLALMGSVTKDCLMAGTLTIAVGLQLWSETVRSRPARVALAGAAIIALLLAAALRVNAFLACTPLAVAMLPRRFTSTIPRLALAGLISSAIFLAVPFVIASALQAEDTDSQLSLIIFDLGGITEHAGTSQFPEMHVVNPVSVNHRCYDPFEWDSYSTWARRPCPLGFERFQALVDEGDTDPRMVWLHAMTSHPLAYAQHRLTHFNLSTWFFVRDDPVPTAWTQSVSNPWNFQVKQNPVLNVIDSTANGAARTPIGWPICWIALAFAVLITCWSAQVERDVTAIAASASLYGVGYLIFGVATGMRYYMWTIIGTALAAVLLAGELTRDRKHVDRRTVIAATATVAVPTMLAAFARLAL